MARRRAARKFVDHGRSSAGIVDGQDTGAGDRVAAPVLVPRNGVGSRRRALRRTALLGSVALTGIVAAGTTAQSGGSTSSTPLALANLVGKVAAQRQSSSAQAAALSHQSTMSLTAAAQALANVRAMQAAALATPAATNAINAALNVPTVPNGTVTGGLVADTSASSVWQGVAPPSAVTTPDGSGEYTVTLTQTQQNAIASWTTFDIGANTTLDIMGQQSNWSLLNRVTGDTNPTYVIGHINAAGAVYVINPNGIIFGAGSQVNVHALIASTLDVGNYTYTAAARNSFFLNNGIGSQSTVNGSANLAEDFSAPAGPGGSTTTTSGTVTVAAGASITTNVVAPDSPGFIYLFGADVTNSGLLSSPEGEVALVAATQSVTLMPGSYAKASSSGTLPFTGFVANQFNTIPTAPTYRTQAYAAGTGVATNSGIVNADRGTTMMIGQDVDMSGVISAQTGISRYASVFLDAADAVNMTGTISILPDANDTTPFPLISSALSATSTQPVFVPPNIEMSANSVNLNAGALVSAPGATVTLTATTNSAAREPVPGSTNYPTPEQVYMASGATIDVSGLQDVVLPASYNIISFQPRGNELANFPIQKPSVLYDSTVYVDIRNTGTLNGVNWVGTPILDASGFVAQVDESISQLLTKGGSVNISTDILSANANNYGANVTLAQGSIINVRGGYVQFLPGYVHETTVSTASGLTYDISKADPTQLYTNVNTVTAYEQGYIEGHDAGGVTISTINPVLDGTLDFGSVIGSRQILSGVAPAGTTTITLPVGSFSVPTQASVNDMVPGEQLPSQGYLSLFTPSSVTIGASNGQTAWSVSNLGQPGAVTTPGTVDLSAATLSGYNLSALNIVANSLTESAGSTLILAPGGRFSATTSGSVSAATSTSIDIEGTIAAPGGQIALTTDPFDLNSYASNLFLLPNTATTGRADIVIGSAPTSPPTSPVPALLDVAGVWSNDFNVPDSQVTGPGYINGGSITLATDNAAGGVAAARGDATGSIYLYAGSLLDASSGGYINQLGAMKMASTEVPAGNGGNISLLTYQGKTFGSGPASPFPGGSTATIQMDGTLFAYGFAKGGTLTIASGNSVQIGGSAPAVGSTTLWLPTAASTVTDPSLYILGQGGFSNYVIQAVSDGKEAAGGNSPVDFGEITVDGVVDLQQQNFSNTVNYSGVATGNLLSVASEITLPESERSPVNLSLIAPYVTIASGATIETDPQASVNIGVTNIASNSAALINGSIVDPDGQVTIQMPTVWFGPNADIDLAGVLVPNALYDQVNSNQVTGTLLPGGALTINTNTTNSATAVAPGYVVGATTSGQAGPTIDVSGASGYVGSNAITPTLAWSDGGTISINTGTFEWEGTLKGTAGNTRGNNGTFVLGGSKIGVQQAAVTTTFTAPSDAKVISVNFGTYTGYDIASASQLGSFDTIYLAGGTTSVGPMGFFNQIATFNAGFEAANGIAFNGPVNWTVRNRLFLEGSDIGTLTGDNVTLNAAYVLFSQGAGSTGVSFSASSATLTVNADTLDVLGLDVANFATTYLNSTGDIRLGASPYATAVAPLTTYTDASGNIVRKSAGPPTAFLQTNGNIELDADRIYPETGVDFTITSPGTVQFAAPANSGVAVNDVPLSAGGSLTVAAATINQNGNLFVPSGTLSLQGGSSVTLAAGSITSVSLGNATVPFGQTLDGTNWFYSIDTDPVAVPPAKIMQLTGGTVSINSGATIDLQGGGNLQAIEFVPGTGGTRDALSTATNPTGQTVYALLPSQSNAVAAYDANFANSLGDVQPLAGQQIYLNGGNGIAAGYYTLYPAHYATLPGALRVVVYGNELSLGMPTGRPVTEPDGTQLIAGYFAQQNIGARSSTEEIFAVETNAVWTQYSEIDKYTANNYFTAAAQAAKTAIPPLPVDGGQMVVAAGSTLNFDAPVLSQGAAGGTGGELDISGSEIDLVGQANSASAPNGYTAIDVAQLSASGFQSILIGGTRSTISSGTLITPTATSILVDTDGSALTAPEIIITATASTTGNQSLPVTDGNGNVIETLGGFTEPSAGTGSITVKSGSVIEATGAAATDTRNYVIGNTNAANFTGSYAAYLATVLGGTVDGTGNVLNGATYSSSNFNNYVLPYGQYAVPSSVLMVSTDANATVTRRGILAGGPITVNFTGVGSVTLPTNGAGTVSIAAGAQVGGSASGSAAVANLTVNAPSISIDPSSLAGLKGVAIETGAIGIGSGAGATGGIVISPALLAKLSSVANLNLTAYTGGVTLYGAVSNEVAGSAPALQNLTLNVGSISGDGSASTDTLASAGTLTLLNTWGGASSTAATVSGASLEIAAPVVDFGGGKQDIAGFSTIGITGGTRIEAQGAGALGFGGDGGAVAATLTTPVFVVDAGTSGSVGVGTQFSMTTAGTFTLAAASGAASVTGSATNIGGNLAITAAIIDDASTIQALSGNVTLVATSADINLDSGAAIKAGGLTQTFFDQTVYSPGGHVVLTSNLGNITTVANSLIDVSQPAGGQAAGGEVDINAAAGQASLAGTIALAGPTVVTQSTVDKVTTTTVTPTGFGGILNIDTASNFDLDSLATQTSVATAVATSSSGSKTTVTTTTTPGIITGVPQQISVETATGNLTLDYSTATTTTTSTNTTAGTTTTTTTTTVTTCCTLAAHSVTLTADDPTAGNGQVNIYGTINASGMANASSAIDQAGGSVSLYGWNDVNLGPSGIIDVSTTASTATGGSVTMGIASAALGLIDLQANSKINVSGGALGAGGTILLRAPVVTNAGSTAETFTSSQGDASISIPASGQDVLIGSLDSTINGGPVTTTTTVNNVTTTTTTTPGIRSFVIEPYTTYTAGDGSGFNGTIDPNGWVQPNGNWEGVWWSNSSKTTAIGLEINGVRYVPVGNPLISLGSTVNYTVDTNPSDLSGYFDPAALNDTMTAIGGNQTAITVYALTENVNLADIKLFTGNSTGSLTTPPQSGSIPYFVQNPITAATLARLTNSNGADSKSFVSSLGLGVSPIQPGIEFDNPTTAYNGGNITVVGNWNLAAGTAYSSTGVALATNGTFVPVQDPTTGATNSNASYIQFLYRYGLNPGALTMRAIGNIVLDASISDGFFQFQDYENSSYQTTALKNYETSLVNATLQRQVLGDGGSAGSSLAFSYTLNSWTAVPVAPYNVTANGVSPTSEQLAASDLFPAEMDVLANGAVSPVVTLEGSWSYRFTGGANLNSANPTAVGSLTTYGDTASGSLAGSGNVILAGHTSYSQAFGYAAGSAANPTSTTVNLPTMIRTGTGNIDISAARDVELTDTLAPGTIYAAGVNAPLLPGPEYTLGTVQVFNSTLTTTGLIAGNDSGFLEPQVLDCFKYCTPSGPLTAAAYPEQGGNITITAGQDIIGYQNVTTTSGGKTEPLYQFYLPWMYAMGQADATAYNGDFGYYSVQIPGHGPQTAFPIQTSWWIQFGSFDQGVLSGGGNVTVVAGRDLRDFSVSLPSTGRVSGGLAAGNTPQTHVYGSGNMVVRVGRNLDSGSFYEGSGVANITVGGTVTSDWSGIVYNSSSVPTTVPVSTVLAVDSGQIDLTAAGSITISAIINPAELRAQNSQNSQGSVASFAPLFMDTYGPASSVDITSIGGSVTIQPNALTGAPAVEGELVNNSIEPFGALTEYGNTNNSLVVPGFMPPSLQVTALSGNIATPRTFTLADSDSGLFNLMAYGTLDLTGGETIPATAGSGITWLATGEISAGASLIDGAFDPYQPNQPNLPSGQTSTTTVSTPYLAHYDAWNVDQIAHLYAVTGNIDGGAQVEINRPAEVQAGGNIVDLNLTVQNIRSSDVSSVIAGGNIDYTGLDKGGGLQIAGPGYFDVEAGGTIGPFLPAAYDVNTAAQPVYPQGITSVGNDALLLDDENVGASTSYVPVALPVGNDEQLQANTPYISTFSTEFIGPTANAIGGNTQVPTTGTRNLYLPTTGASIVVMFGVSKGVDYTDFENKYINPATATVNPVGTSGAAATYAGTDLQNFLAGLGLGYSQKYVDTIESAVYTIIGGPAGPTANAPKITQAMANWYFFSNPAYVTAAQQRLFVDQVFFDELREVGNGVTQSSAGYTAVNTLFPASWGYTANQLNGTNGAKTLVGTGNLNLLHSSIQTQQGGDISIFGPGGSILVGSTAPEANANLKINNLGILTLAGGSVLTFTDQSVLVNDSRVFTEQGGDILMWSSNGNLDAGKGSRTTASYPPLDVLFDDNDFESLDLEGYVTGAGIGTLQTVSSAEPSSVYLMAPRGTVNAGEGVRSSGAIHVIAPIVINGNNFSAGGPVTGVTAPPAISAATMSAANSAGGSSDSATKAGAPAPNRAPLVQHSIVTVEVLVLGSGDSAGAQEQSDSPDNQKKKKGNP